MRDVVIPKAASGAFAPIGLFRMLEGFRRKAIAIVFDAQAKHAVFPIHRNRDMPFRMTGGIRYEVLENARGGLYVEEQILGQFSMLRIECNIV